MVNKKCYMCDNDATSREHIPPLCLFPEAKDTNGINFRKSLITVPSCEIHNSKKSDDDEFLMFSLSGLMKNNIVGNIHHITKVNRALRRKNKDFLTKEILRNHRFARIRSTENNFRLISIGYPNLERLSNCLRHIAYGLFYHEFDYKFDGEITMILEFLESTDINMITFKKFLKKRFEAETELCQEVKGENPSVFYYQFIKPDQFGLIAMRMVFYGTAEVYFSFLPINKKAPFDLGMSLMGSGVKTTIVLNGEDFVFNESKPD
jgi:hypothetical protein